LFVPFAYSHHQEYTDLARAAFAELEVAVTGAHEVPLQDVNSITESYDAVFCGAGNTFLLLAELYQRDLLHLIRDAVARGVRYMGSSAGAIVAGPTIGTTNDMPIVETRSLAALGLIPFGINPHYFERPESFQHMGETRRDRIREFQEHNNISVLALCEGAILLMENGEARLAGRKGGIAFRWDATRRTVTETSMSPGESVAFLWE